MRNDSHGPEHLRWGGIQSGRRIVRGYAAAVLAASLILASCTSATDSEGGAASTSAGEPVSTTGPVGTTGGPTTTLFHPEGWVGDVFYPEGWVGPVVSDKDPIVDETVTLRVVVPQTLSAGDLAENAFTKWYEERTNVHIEWEVIPGEAQEVLTKVNAMIASGDLPDVFMGIDFSPAQQLLYGSQGLFRPLNDLIEDYGTETKRLFADYPYVEDAITAPDGNIYSIPYFNGCIHCQTGSQPMWIYQPWLDALGLDMPQTLDEFEQVLLAFKNDDPNGNGEADEIPLMGWDSEPLSNFIMGSFMYNPGPFWFNPAWLFVDDGNVDITVNKPEWREGLQYLNRLYEQGLIADETFTQDQEQFRRIGDQEGEPVLGVARAFYWGYFMTIQAEEDARWHGYVEVPTLEGPTGTRISAFDYYYSAPNVGHFVILNSSEHPDVAFQWGDGMYEYETTMRMNYGIKGKDWQWAEEGDVGIYGGQAQWKHVDGESWPPDDGDWWGGLGVSYVSDDHRTADIADPDNFSPVLYKESEKYVENRQDIELQLPPLFLTEEQAAFTGEIGLAIENHVKQHEAQFINGELDIDDDAAWADYVDILQQIGLEQYLQAYQEAYDAR